MEQIWTFLQTGPGLILIGSIVLFALNLLYAKKPAWRKFEGTIITAIRLAEKNISDDTANKSLARLDDALEYVIGVYETVEKKRATAKTQAALREAIAIKHDEMKL